MPVQPFLAGSVPECASGGEVAGLRVREPSALNISRIEKGTEIQSTSHCREEHRRTHITLSKTSMNKLLHGKRA